MSIFCTQPNAKLLDSATVHLSGVFRISGTHLVVGFRANVQPVFTKSRFKTSSHCHALLQAQTHRERVGLAFML